MLFEGPHHVRQLQLENKVSQWLASPQTLTRWQKESQWLIGTIFAYIDANFYLRRKDL